MQRALHISLLAAALACPRAAHAQVEPRDAEAQMKTLISSVLKQLKTDSKTHLGSFQDLLSSLQSSLRSDPALAAVLISSAMLGYAEFVADLKNSADQGQSSVSSQLSSLLASLNGSATGDLLIGGCGLHDTFSERMDAEIGKAVRKAAQQAKKFIASAEKTGNVRVTANFNEAITPNPVAIDHNGSATITSNQPIAAVAVLDTQSGIVDITYQGLGAPNQPQSVISYNSSGQAQNFQPTANSKGMTSISMSTSSSGPIGSVVVYGNGQLALTAAD